MRAAFLFAAVVATAPCLAAEPSARTYAVLSLVGDRYMVAGQNVDAVRPSPDAFAELPAGAVDTAATLAIEDALREAEPASKTVLLRARGADFFSLQSDVLDKGGAVQDLYRSLRSRLGELPATHLILLTKLRQEPSFRGTFTCDRGTPCVGRVEGVGVYAATRVELRAPETDEWVYAFLAPFAYVRLSLFDLRTGDLVAQEIVTEARIFAAAPDKDPKDVLTAQEKVAAMQGVVVSGVRSAIPKLIRKR